MTVTRVPVPYDGVPGGAVTAHVIDGDRPVLVDPPKRHATIDDLLEDSTPSILTTHHHPDHVSGVAAYAKTYDATVWCRMGRASDFADATGVTPDRQYRVGDRIANALTVIGTPGHTPEHVSFCCSEGLLCGDLAVADGSVAVTAPEGDLRAYLSSLRRVLAHGPRRLYPGHGRVISEPRATCARLLTHRLDRERAVLRAVANGARTLGGVTDEAYEKDVSAVREVAVATVEAHVEKLAVEGRVRWDGECVVPT